MVATVTPPHQPPPSQQPQLFNLTIFIIFFIITTTLSQYPGGANALNITDILSHYPDLSHFTSLLTTSGVSLEVNHRTSLTLLAVPNHRLTTLTTTTTSPSSLPDLLRSHFILQFLTWSDLRRAPPSGELLPTLLQTTGRSSGSLNLTFNPSDGVASFHPLSNATFSSTIIALLKTMPFNLSIFTVDALINPGDYDLTASETRPPPPGINITKALLDGHNFNVAASMLAASGVVSEFEKAEAGAGITIFAPTDLAFSNLPASVNLQALPAEQKSLVLKFHVLLSYYPLGSLESIVNPVQPTLGTEDNGAGSFTLNISRVNGSVAINTGLIQAVVTQTVSDQNPVAIFGVSNVLLPKEIFGKGSEVSLRSGSGGGPRVGTQPPDIGPTPENRPDVGYDEPSHLSSPPGIASSGCQRRHGGGWGFVGACIGGGLLMYVFV